MAQIDEKFLEELSVHLQSVSTGVHQLDQILFQLEEERLASIKAILDGFAAGTSYRIDDLFAKKNKLLVLGRLGSGKSSLINALLDDNLLPTRVVPTTAVNTIIEFGTANAVTLFDKQQNTSEISLREFVESYQLDNFVSVGSYAFGQIDFALLPYENGLLTEGIQIVDTPGLGNNSVCDQVAMRFLSQAHIVIYLLDASQPFKQSDYELINMILDRVSLSQVFFVINKLDLLRTEKDIADVRMFIRRCLEPYYLRDIDSFATELYNRRVFLLSSWQAHVQKVASPDNRQVTNPSLQRFNSEISMASDFSQNGTGLQIFLEDICHRLEISLSAISQIKDVLKQINNRTSILGRRVDQIQHDLIVDWEFFRSALNNHNHYEQKDVEVESSAHALLQAAVDLEIVDKQDDTLPDNDKPEEQFRIFLSYRRSDSSGYTGRIYDRLLEHFDGEQIFIDVGTINPGDNFVDAISHALNQCNILIAVIGSTWASVTDSIGNKRLADPADWVRIEVLTALERGIPIIPVLVMDTKPLTPNELPDALKKLTEINVARIRDETFHEDVARLIENILQRQRTLVD